MAQGLCACLLVCANRFFELLADRVRRSSQVLERVAPSNVIDSRQPRIEAVGMTDIGRRRQRNEDAYWVASLYRSMLVHDASPAAERGWMTGNVTGTLLVVADGMGGHAGGDVASRLAVGIIADYVLNLMPWLAQSGHLSRAREPNASLPEIREQLSSALLAGDTTVRSAGARAGTPQMGTTLTAAFLHWPILYVAHVGDSRCYILRSDRLSRLTTDHTLGQKVAERDGDLSQVPLAWHNMLWNCLGGSEELAKPQITKTTLEVGDRLLLCSDGLTTHVSDDEIALVLSKDGSNTERCAELIRLANDAGGSDNITVVIASIQ